MGNSWACFYPYKDEKPSQNYPPLSFASTNKKDRFQIDEALLHKQALAAALLSHQRKRNDSTSIPFNRSTSVAYPPSVSRKQSFSRSSSTRQSLPSDSIIQPHQLVINQNYKHDKLETNHFVLVHGGGYGAWCWYKTITLLEEGGFKVDAVDLTGSGIHSYETHKITCLAEYVKPLTDVIERLEEGRKVILVGHDFGGTCISYVMELHPSRIAKAVFVAATMLTDGQSTLDIFSKEAGSNDLMQKAQVFLYTNGKEKPPTAIGIDKSLMKDLLFNQSTAKDAALASVSMRPIPFAPITEHLSLSHVNYGSVRRYYIVTQQDCAIHVPLQEMMISLSPPEQVFHLKGSDHSPFLSRPQGLHKILVQIAQSIPRGN